MPQSPMRSVRSDVPSFSPMLDPSSDECCQRMWCGIEFLSSPPTPAVPLVTRTAVSLAAFPSVSSSWCIVLRRTTDDEEDRHHNQHEFQNCSFPANAPMTWSFAFPIADGMRPPCRIRGHYRHSAIRCVRSGKLQILLFAEKCQRITMNWRHDFPQFLQALLETFAMRREIHDASETHVLAKHETAERFLLSLSHQTEHLPSCGRGK
jgi:hypothetical protein